MSKLAKLKGAIKEIGLARIISTSTAITLYQTSQLNALKLDSVIAGIPIIGVKHEDHASSDEILKYRSMGGVFLAHQKGGKRTFRTTLYLVGPSRLFLLETFKALQANGMQRDVNIMDSAYAGDLEAMDPDAAPERRYLAQNSDIEEETYAYHKTFPIVTDSIIYTHMYLETLRYREDIELGKDIIEVDLAFREYLPPTKFAWKPATEEGDKPNYDVWRGEEETRSAERASIIINTMWGFKKFGFEIYKLVKQNEKVGKSYNTRYGVKAASLLAGAAIAGMFTR